MHLNYLDGVKQQFQYYKKLADDTFDQLAKDDFFWHINSETNSIAIIVHHLYGNMKSRWTDFLTTDGEKVWRNRDLEFKNTFKTKVEVLEKWEAGWSCLFEALESIKPKDLGSIVYIRNQGHTVIEALNRQLAHYAYHVGQIVFIGKMRKGEKWRSLSIPKGQSDVYNAEKFKIPKHRRHFSEDYLDDEKSMN